MAVSCSDVSATREWTHLGFSRELKSTISNLARQVVMGFLEYRSQDPCLQGSQT